MGGALDVFRDLTEEGNNFTPDSAALPTQAELLETLKAAEAYEQDRGLPPGLQFLVADVPASQRRRTRVDSDPKRVKKSNSDGSTPNEARPSFHNMEDWLQKVKLRVEAKTGRRKWLFRFGNPEQVVVQGDGKEERQSTFEARPRSGTKLVPVERVRALRGGMGGLLLTQDRLMDLQEHMPVVTRLANRWKLIYCPAVHGVSLRAFFRQCENWPGETMLLARDHNGVVFGGFATHTWRPSSQSSYFGSPECFVFTYGAPPGDEDEDGELPMPTVHRWAGGEQQFMYADRTGFGMGGGNGYAFWISEDLLTCSSAPSKTFNTTEPLASQRDVVVTTIECWSFDRDAAMEVDRSCSLGGPSAPSSPEARRSQMREDAMRWEAFA